MLQGLQMQMDAIRQGIYAGLHLEKWIDLTQVSGMKGNTK